MPGFPRMPCAKVRSRNSVSTRIRLTASSSLMLTLAGGLEFGRFLSPLNEDEPFRWWDWERKM